MTFIIENQFLWLFLKIRDKVRPGKGVTGTRDKTRQIRDDPGKYGTSGHPELEWRDFVLIMIDDCVLTNFLLHQCKPLVPSAPFEASGDESSCWSGP